ncbi:MAG TPA: hypothetical protein VMZ00_03925 [Sporichthya sp.]|nr:hypothetical protein [Sporichthya sp.]
MDGRSALASPVFAVLHGVRLKGSPTIEALAALLGAAPHQVGAALKELAEAGDVDSEAGAHAVHWHLTATGRRRYAAELAARRRPSVEAALALARDLMTDLLPELECAGADVESLVSRVRPILAEGGAFEPRLLQYLARLETAAAGSADKVVEVWTECRNDLALLAWC